MEISVLLFFWGLVLVQLSQAQVVPQITEFPSVTELPQVKALPQLKELQECSKKYLCDCGPSGFSRLSQCFDLFTKEYKQKMADAWNGCGITKKNVTYDDFSTYRDQLCPIPFEDKVECYAKFTLALVNYMTELKNNNRIEEFKQNDRRREKDACDTKTCLQPLIASCTANPEECSKEESPPSRSTHRSKETSRRTPKKQNDIITPRPETSTRYIIGRDGEIRRFMFIQILTRFFYPSQTLRWKRSSNFSKAPAIPI